MPIIIAALGAFAAVCQLAKVLVEKLVPSKVHKTREFKTKQKVVDMIDKRRLITIEQIQAFGKKQGIV